MDRDRLAVGGSNVQCMLLVSVAHCLRIRLNIAVCNSTGYCGLMGKGKGGTILTKLASVGENDVRSQRFIIE